MNRFSSVRSPRLVRRALRVALVLASIVLPSPAPALEYFTTQSLGAGVDPYAISFTDLDHDGRDDLVSRNASDSSVTIWRGLGDGAFGMRSDVQTAGVSIAHVVADVTGDGHPDLVAADYYQSLLEVRPGVGDGTFGGPITYPTAGGPSIPVVGDFNGDGRQDVAVLCWSASVVSVLRGAAGGGLLPRTDLQLPPGAFGLAAADLNGDGRSDLAATVWTENLVVVWLANSSGTFSQAFNYAVGPNPRVVCAGDLNADGRPELIVSRRYRLVEQAVTVLVNDAGGFFPSQTDHVLVAMSQVEGLAVADFNRDGKMDVAASGYPGFSGGLEILLGAGDGSIATSFSGLGSQSIYLSGWVAVGDADGDSWPDVVVSGGDAVDSLTVCRNVGNHSPVTHARKVARNLSDYFSLGTAGDVDRDGLQDVVLTGGSAQELKVLFGDGRGSFRSEVIVAQGQSYSEVALADVYGLGRRDILATSWGSGTVSVFRNLGSGTFAPPVTHAVPPYLEGLATGDLDGNGRPDIVTASYFPDAVSVLFATAPGTFAPPVSIPTGLYPAALLVRDLDGDGDLDIVTGGSNVVSVLLGDGTGQFAPRVDYPTGENTASLAAGDFDGDGRLDLAVGGDSLRVHPGLGAGAFGPSVAYPGPYTDVYVAAEDFDRDGVSDVATTSPGSDGLELRAGSPGSPLRNAVQYKHVNGPTIADMDTDGWPDIVGLDNAHLQLVVLLNLGGPLPVGVGPGPPGPTTAGPRDLRLSIAPNPTRGPIAVHYHLGEAATGTLELFDVSGRRVPGVERAFVAGAEPSLEWNLEARQGVPPGLYFVRLSTPLGTLTRRLAVLN